MSSPAAGTAAAPAGDTLAPMEVSDSDLMQRYAAGELAAFEQLYARYKGPLYRYLKRMCHDTEVANDLFQEVWSKLIASRERYEVRAQFNTYLYRIAHNACIDFYRRAGKQTAHDSDDEVVLVLPDAEHARPDSQAANSQVQAAFRVALQALPAEQRDVFLMYEESGLSLDDIGRVQNVNVETAKSRLRYAVAKLRAALRGHRVPEAVT